MSERKLKIESDRMVVMVILNEPDILAGVAKRDSDDIRKKSIAETLAEAKRSLATAVDWLEEQTGEDE